MKLKITILLFSYSTLLLSSNNCSIPKMIEPVDCSDKVTINNLEISDFEFSRKLETYTVLKGLSKLDKPSFAIANNAWNFTDPDSKSSDYLSGITIAEYLPAYTPSDIKFNIVYDTMVSITYEPWEKFWVVDHFMFEYITDKYRNAFTMFTLKIDIL